MLERRMVLGIEKRLLSKLQEFPWLWAILHEWNYLANISVVAATESVLRQMVDPFDRRTPTVKQKVFYLKLRSLSGVQHRVDIVICEPDELGSFAHLALKLLPGLHAEKWETEFIVAVSPPIAGYCYDYDITIYRSTSKEKLQHTAERILGKK